MPDTPRAQRLVELCHVITAGMTTYPGLPGPDIDQHLSREDSRGRYAPGTEFAIDRITMVGNTGTYLDSPYHRYGDGADLADLPLAKLADLPAVVLRSAARGIPGRRRCRSMNSRRWTELLEAPESGSADMPLPRGLEPTSWSSESVGVHRGSAITGGEALVWHLYELLEVPER